MIPSSCSFKREERRSTSSPLERAEAVLARAALLGKPLLVAVSGGCDSVCLLRLLAEVAGRRGGSVHAAHVDHGLRRDSSEDAVFCRELAAGLRLPFHLHTFDRQQFRLGESVQAEARRLRREVLERCMAANRLEAIALGHHLDDQAETVLFRLLRGTATRGAAGMAPWTPPYVRPLLDVTRAELRRLAEERGWSFREDPSNASDRYQRNRIRHHVLPALRSVTPRPEEALVRFAQRMAEDEAALSRLAGAELERSARREAEGIRIPARTLAGLPPAIRRRMYLALWAEIGCAPSRLEARHLEAVDALLEQGRAHRRAPVPGPGAFLRSYEDLWALRPETLRGDAVFEVLCREGPRPLGHGGRLLWGTHPPAESPAIRIPRGRPVDELVARTWRPGDRVAEAPSTKVKDLLMEARVPAWRRSRALLVRDGRGVLGILAPGFAWSAFGEPDAGETTDAVWAEGSWFAAGAFPR